jgi:hypothetical protein
MVIYKKYNVHSEISLFNPKIIKFYTNYLEKTIGTKPNTYIYVKISDEYSFYARSNDDNVIEYLYYLDYNEHIIEKFIELKKLYN